MLARQALADRRYLTELFLVELGSQVSERYGVFVLLKLPSLPLLLEPLAELAYLDGQSVVSISHNLQQADKSYSYLLCTAVALGVGGFRDYSWSLAK